MLKSILFMQLILLTALFCAEQDSLTGNKTYEIPSVTVTSTKAEFGISPVPFSQMDKFQIEKTYSTQDIPQMLSDLPSITFYSQNGNGIGYSNLTMRGFDQRRISVMINGIPQNDPEDHNVYWVDFPDIASSVESIQVQRGAGLINYGAAAIGGSINLTTSNFVNHKGTKIYSGFGMQDYGDVYQTITNKYAVEFSSGMVGKYSFYGKLSRINSDGYRDNSFSKLNSLFFGIARFDENFTTQINIFGGALTDGLAYTGVPKEYITNDKARRYNYSAWKYDSTGKTIDPSAITVRRKQETEGFTQPHFEILNDWFITDNLTFKSSLFYYTGYGYYNFDGSWCDTNYLKITSEYGYNPTDNPRNTLIKAYVDNKHGGWIPRLSYKHSGGELIVGAEIRMHRSEHYGNIEYAENLPAGYDPDYKFYSNEGKRDIFSLFAREKYDVTDDLTVYAEGQLVRQSYRLGNEKFGNKYVTHLTLDGEVGSNGEDIFNIKYLFFNPRMSANYKLSDKFNIYGLGAYTSREPRMRNLYPIDDAYWGAAPLFEGVIQQDGKVRYDFSKPLVKPESMLDVEIGCNMKNSDYYFNINFYHMKYSDELVKSGKVDIFGSPVEGNAPRTTHYGLELEASADLFKSNYGKLNIYCNSTISKNEINEYDFICYDLTKISLEGNEIAGFPSFMANLKLNYNLKNFDCILTGKYVGEFRTDNYGDLLTSNAKLIEHLRQDWNTGYYADNVNDSYVIFNLDLAYTLDKLPFANSLKVQAQVYNLFDKYYSGGGEGKDFFVGAGRSLFFGFELGL